MAVTKGRLGKPNRVRAGARYVPKKRAAEYCHVDERQIDRWEKEGLITAITLPVNGHLRFDLEELDEFMAVLKNQSKISLATEIVARLAGNS